MKLIKHMYFKKIRDSNICKMMASLDDEKISLVPDLLTIVLYSFISCDPKNRSKCCLKTLKIVKIEPKTTLKTLKMVIKMAIYPDYGFMGEDLMRSN